jgi:hypothetical protein
VKGYLVEVFLHEETFNFFTTLHIVFSNIRKQGFADREVDVASCVASFGVLFHVVHFGSQIVVPIVVGDQERDV